MERSRENRTPQRCQFSTEFEIALPQELNKAEREKLVDELCNKIVERHNVIVDAAIHAPHTDSGSDERNYHAHIMFTGRQIDLETGDFAAKKIEILTKKIQAKPCKNGVKILPT